MEQLLAEFGGVAGGRDGVGGGEGVDVVVGDEEGGVGGGEDDYFWRWGRAVGAVIDGGGEGGNEGGEVGGEFGVPEVEGGVVHGGADDGGG